MSCQKRKVDEIDPEYVFEKSKVIKTEENQQERISKLQEVIRIEFEKEIQFKEQELLDIDDRLHIALKTLHLLKYACVSTYYNRKTLLAPIVSSTILKVDSDVSSCYSFLGSQTRPHPAVKKLLGQEVPTELNSSDAFNTRRNRKTTCFNLKKDLKCENADDVSAKPTVNNSIIAEKRKEVKNINSIEREELKEPSDISSHSSSSYASQPGRNQRHKTRHRVIVGNISKWLEPTNENSDMSTHKWMVYVRGPKEQPDVSHIIQKVRFFLHPSYKPNDVVEIASSPYQLTRRGWGEFPLRVQIHFNNHLNKPVDIIHNLKLDRTHSGLQKLGAETVVDVWLFTETTEKPVIKMESSESVKLSEINELSSSSYSSSSSSKNKFETIAEISSDATIKIENDTNDVNEANDTVIESEILENNEDNSHLKSLLTNKQISSPPNKMHAAIKNSPTNAFCPVYNSTHPTNVEHFRTVQTINFSNETKDIETIEKKSNNIITSPNKTKLIISPVKNVNSNSPIATLISDVKNNLNNKIIDSNNLNGLNSLKQLNSIQRVIKNGNKYYLIKKIKSEPLHAVVNNFKLNNVVSNCNSKSLETPRDLCDLSENVQRVYLDHDYFKIIANDLSELSDLNVNNSIVGNQISSSPNATPANLISRNDVTPSGHSNALVQQSTECEVEVQEDFQVRLGRCITNVPSALLYLFRHVPIISASAANPSYLKLYPFSAVSRTEYMRWSNVKKFCSEWYRAKLIKEMLTEYEINGSEHWTIKSIIQYSKLLKHSCSYQTKDLSKLYATPSPLPTSVYNSYNVYEQTEHTTPTKSNPIKKLKESDEEDCNVDVVGDDSSPRKLQVKGDENPPEPGHIIDEGNVDVKLAYQYIREKSSQIGINFQPEAISEGALYPTNECVIYAAMKCLANELLRRALANSRIEHESQRSINLDSVKAALQEREEFDVFFNVGLGRN